MGETCSKLGRDQKGLNVLAGIERQVGETLLADSDGRSHFEDMDCECALKLPDVG